MHTTNDEGKLVEWREQYDDDTDRWSGRAARRGNGKTKRQNGGDRRQAQSGLPGAALGFALSFPVAALGCLGFALGKRA